MTYIKKYHHELRLRWIKKLIGKGSVLDVGCSDASLLLMLDNKKKMGVDINKEQIERNKKLYKDIYFKFGDIVKLPLKESFDYVVCSEVLEHLENPEKAISELHRVCRRYLIVSVPTYLSLFCIRRHYDNPKANVGVGHIQGYTLKKIQNQLEKNGFVVRKVVGTRFVTIPNTIAKKIRHILLPIDLYLDDKPFFRIHGFHTIIKAEKVDLNRLD